MQVKNQGAFSSLVIDNIVGKIRPIEVRRIELQRNFDIELSKINDEEDAIFEGAGVEMTDDEYFKVWEKVNVMRYFQLSRNIRQDMPYKGDKINES